jgi:hypothetical protein
MNPQKSNHATTAVNLQQLPVLVRAILANRGAGKSPARDPHWTLVDSPERPACVPADRDVPVLTAATGVRYVRTPEERFTGLHGSCMP